MQNNQNVLQESGKTQGKTRGKTRPKSSAFDTAFIAYRNRGVVANSAMLIMHELNKLVGVIVGQHLINYQTIIFF